MRGEKFHRSMDLTGPVRDDLLDRIDAAEQLLAFGSARLGMDEPERFRFRSPEVQLTVEHPGGGHAQFCVCSRNISSQGVSVIHTGYLHANTRCEIGLPSVWRTHERLPGRVRDCAHVTGPYHAVDIVFDKPIDLRRYLDRTPALARYLAKNLKPGDLSGDLLYLDDQKIECQLLAHHLRETKVRVVTATDPGEALAALKEQDFQVVMCDLNLENVLGEDVIRTMREEGFVGAIIVLTGESDPARLQAARDAGAMTILEKPYDAARLLPVLSEWLSMGGEGSQDALVSELAGKPEMAGLLREYLTTMAKTLDTMRKGIQADDATEVRKACQFLKETGGSYGYPSLSEAAQSAVQSLQAGEPVRKCGRQLAAVEQICQRMIRGGSRLNGSRAA